MIVACATTRIQNLVNRLVHVPIDLLEHVLIIIVEGMVPFKVTSKGFLFYFYGTDTRAEFTYAFIPAALVGS
jgi:hypothetical protein